MIKLKLLAKGQVEISRDGEDLTNKCKTITLLADGKCTLEMIDPTQPIEEFGEAAPESLVSNWVTDEWEQA